MCSKNLIMYVESKSENESVEKNKYLVVFFK